jgi:hypothetical protein
MRPLRERPLDLILVLCFASFAITSFVFDPYTALDVDLASSRSPAARLTYWFAAAADPLILHPPPFVRIMVALSVIGLGPTYLVLIYGISKERPWVRTPALVYSAVKIYSMIVYLGVAIGSATDYVLFSLVYVPYVAVPVLVLARMWRPDPFRRALS